MKKLDGDAFDRARAVIGPLHQRASAGQRGLFYFDESGFRPNQPIKYGWSLIGQVRSVKPRAHRQRVNVPGVLRQDGKPVSCTQQRPTVRNDVIGCNGFAQTEVFA
ncbi:transposase [Noviherbaspirillum soli]|uniref:transposase n=1 Tax=Noviherbaspirillum soli TaxID=1064518 RepID=UPI00188C2012|nr:transposase [Noviherbaspirillum soli]